MDVEWLKTRKRELGVTDAALAEALGVERSVANKVVNGKVTMNVRRIDAIAELLLVTRDEMMARAGFSAQSAPVPQEPMLPPTRTVDGGEVAMIPRLDLSLPMGPGATVDDYVEEEPVAFDLGYLRTFTRTPPHRLRLAAGAGDSMFPTLVPNDLVWIDTTQNQLLHADRIYAASINGGAAIKRLRPVAGGTRVLVISDNKAIEPYEVDASDVVIWGRVIRFARDL